MQRIYLDHAATAPLDAAAREAMRPWLSDRFQNPSSLYEGGRRARMALDEARETLAEALRCLPGEVVFTSSGTEAANLALIGVALARRDGKRNRVLFGATEHHCVLSTAPLLESFGYTVEMIPVGPDGRVKRESLEERLGDDVLLLSVMHANNETGVISDAAAIGGACRERGILYHCDAVQTFGLLPVCADDLNADLISVSAHKLYGPKGAGALYVRAGVKPQPMTVGGAQEREVRAGTENVPAIVGFAAAVQVALKDTSRADRFAAVRDRFMEKTASAFSAACLPEPIYTVPGTVGRRMLPGHAHLRVPGADAEATLINLDRLGVDAGSGAACSSGSIEPSHVLQAMGFSEKESREGLRFTFGKDSTVEEADEAARRLAEGAGQVLAVQKG